MNRLQTELQRLYLSPDRGAMVLELARPASWDAMAKVWRGVQADLDLPAPAIAVSGSDGFQLWFSLAEPAPAAQRLAFLEAVRARYLGEIGRERVAMHPSPHAVLPPVEVATGRWSAFVAQDLAALFSDEPWIDLPPGADQQAELLSRLESTRPADFRRALERLRPAHASPATPAQDAAQGDSLEPRGFLLQVMNDGAVELQLRIEAAKALLPYFEAGRPL